MRAAVAVLVFGYCFASFVLDVMRDGMTAGEWLALALVAWVCINAGAAVVKAGEDATE